jgi:hypothetical protein
MSCRAVEEEVSGVRVGAVGRRDELESRRAEVVSGAS